MTLGCQGSAGVIGGDSDHDDLVDEATTTDVEMKKGGKKMGCRTWSSIATWRQSRQLGVVRSKEEVDSNGVMSNKRGHTSDMNDNFKRSGTLMKGFEFFDGDGHMTYNFFFSLSNVEARSAGWRWQSAVIKDDDNYTVIESDDDRLPQRWSLCSG